MPLRLASAARFSVSTKSASVSPGKPTIAAEGSQVDAGEHDLSIAITDCLPGALDEARLLVAARPSPRTPDDAIGAAMIAAILHLEEEAGPRERRRARRRARGEVCRNVVEDLALSRVRKSHVGAGDGRYARV